MNQAYIRLLRTFEQYTNAAEAIGPEVCVCTLGREIQLFCGIERLAKAFGKPLTLEKKESGQFPYKKSFVQNEIKIYQIYTKEEIEHETNIPAKPAQDISSQGKAVQLELVMEGVCGVPQNRAGSQKVGRIKKNPYRDQAVQVLNRGKQNTPKGNR